MRQSLQGQEISFSFKCKLTDSQTAVLYPARVKGQRGGKRCKKKGKPCLDWVIFALCMESRQTHSFSQVLQAQSPLGTSHTQVLHCGGVPSIPQASHFPVAPGSLVIHPVVCWSWPSLPQEADCAYPSLTMCSGTSDWQLEIGHSVSIYTLCVIATWGQWLLYWTRHFHHCKNGIGQC